MRRAFARQSSFETIQNVQPYPALQRRFGARVEKRGPPLDTNDLDELEERITVEEDESVFAELTNLNKAGIALYNFSQKWHSAGAQLR